jgi:hypothetical protein
MFWFILAALLAVWWVGMVAPFHVGRSIHILPVLAALLLIVRLVTERVVL